MDTTPDQLLRDAVALLRGIPDDKDRAVTASDFLKQLTESRAEVRSIRHESVAALRRSGWSLGQIAALLDVSVQRADQIAKNLTR